MGFVCGILSRINGRGYNAQASQHDIMRNGRRKRGGSLRQMVLAGLAGMGEVLYSSVTTALGGSGCPRVGGVRLPKICCSLLVLFRKRNKCGRDLSLVSKCSNRICLLPILCSISRRAALYAGQIRIK